MIKIYYISPVSLLILPNYVVDLIKACEHILSLDLITTVIILYLQRTLVDTLIHQHTDPLPFDIKLF